MSTPALKVFGITELLERILEQLPPLDIHVSQSVCTTWRNCIKHSTRLKHASWLTTSVSIPLQRSDNWGRPVPMESLNPLIRRFLSEDITFEWGIYVASIRIYVHNRAALTRFLDFHHEWSHTWGPWVKIPITQPPTRIITMFYKGEKLEDAELAFLDYASMKDLLIMVARFNKSIMTPGEKIRKIAKKIGNRIMQILKEL